MTQTPDAKPKVDEQPLRRSITASVGKGSLFRVKALSGPNKNPVYYMAGSGWFIVIPAQTDTEAAGKFLSLCEAEDLAKQQLRMFGDHQALLDDIFGEDEVEFEKTELHLQPDGSVVHGESTRSVHHGSGSLSTSLPESSSPTQDSHSQTPTHAEEASSPRRPGFRG